MEVFIKLGLGDRIAASIAVQILDYQDRLFDFFPYVLLVATAVLDIWVGSKVKGVLQSRKAGGVFGDLYLAPKLVAEGLPVLGDGASDGIEKLGVIEEASSLSIEHFKDRVALAGSDIYPLLLYYLLEFIIVHQRIFVGIGILHRFLKKEKPSGSLGGNTLLYPQNN